MNLRRWHRVSACIVAGFVMVHLFNHLFMLSSVDAHTEMMQILRDVYRQPGLESFLLFCVGFQVLSGLALFIRGARTRRGRLACLQALSGAYLGLFLMIHVAAVLYGRLVLGLDTNFSFAAAGLHVPPNQYFFAPYYFLAIAAVFIHPACAAYWALQSRAALAHGVFSVVSLTGILIAGGLVMAMSGAFYVVEIPPEYRASYQSAGSR